MAGNERKKPREQLRTTKAKQAFLVSYFARGGNVAKAARDAGIKSTKTIYNWIDSDPGFAEKIATHLAEQNEFVEDKLKELIASGHFPAIAFYLRKIHPKYMSTIRRFQTEAQAISYMKWQMEKVEPDQRVFRCADCKSKNIEPSSWGIRTATSSGRAPRLKKYPPAKTAESV